MIVVGEECRRHVFPVRRMLDWKMPGPTDFRLRARASRSKSRMTSLAWLDLAGLLLRWSENTIGNRPRSLCKEFLHSALMLSTLKPFTLTRASHSLRCLSYFSQFLRSPSNQSVPAFPSPVLPRRSLASMAGLDLKIPLQEMPDGHAIPIVSLTVSGERCRHHDPGLPRDTDASVIANVTDIQ